jgi:hypothetical protein
MNGAEGVYTGMAVPASLPNNIWAGGGEAYVSYVKGSYFGILIYRRWMVIRRYTYIDTTIACM